MRAFTDSRQGPNGDGSYGPTAPKAFFGPLWVLARERKTWSPPLLMGVLGRLLIQLGTYHHVLKLLKIPPFAATALDNPRFPFKYLTHDYLARSFRVSERLTCFVYHHKRMLGVLRDDYLHRMLQGDITIHEIHYGCNRVAMTMGLPSRFQDKEGELCLHLEMNNKKLFNLSFTIVPGWVVKSEATETLLISRLQGSAQYRPEIKLALKALRDYSPKQALVAALQGIANALGISEIAAVCATNQSSYCEKCAFGMKRAYDEFFLRLGMSRTAGGFFFISLPIEGRPLALFKPGGRLRAKKRRAMRQEIQAACSCFFRAASDGVVSNSESAQATPPPKRGQVFPKLSIDVSFGPERSRSSARTQTKEGAN